ncbi:MAG: putative glycosyl/glycerophosphate transferase [Microbacterium sp.]|nr:putative glycosyl/glycerophosphate transferase [Microbacterium sp.]
MPLVRDARLAVGLLRKAVATRTARRDLHRALAARGPLPEQTFRIAVYFADGAVNMYQMRQWYAPLRELAETWPVVVISRAIRGADALLKDGELPVAYAPTVRDVEQVLAEQDIRLVFYVNQNTRNFQMFRYGRRWHVFINHLWDYDLDRRTYAIGRPQADHAAGEPPYPADDRTVVLYAPTWEGDRPSAHYGSIRTHGEALVSALLATGRHRVVYRPHPRSGVVDPEYGAANARIIAALTAANRADPSAHHVHDTSPTLGWQLRSTDLAVLDISAMVYDRLAFSAPLLITRPSDPEAEVDAAGYLSACEWLDAESSGDIVAQADRVLGDPEAVERLHQWVRHYFGDTTPGASTARFRAAVDELMDRWETWHAREGDRPD